MQDCRKERQPYQGVFDIYFPYNPVGPIRNNNNKIVMGRKQLIQNQCGH